MKKQILVLGTLCVALSGCMGNGLNPAAELPSTPLGDSTPPSAPAAPSGPFLWIGATNATTATSSWSSANTASVAAPIDGGFSNANGIAVDSTHGFFYVLDGTDSKISKFSISTGAFVGAIGYLTANPNACPTQPNGTTTGWCTGGTFADGQASGRVDGNIGSGGDLAIDPVHDALYVFDGGIGRVAKYVLSTGAYVGSVGMILNTGTMDTHGGAGTAANCPAAGAVAARAMSWCKGGKFVESDRRGGFKKTGGGTGIDVDTVTQNIYVGEFSGRLIKMDSNGAFVGAIGEIANNPTACSTTGSVTNGWCPGSDWTFYSASSVDGGFASDSFPTVDSANDRLYVVNGSSGKISKFVLSTGVFVGTIGYISGANPNACATMASGATAGWCTGADYSISNVDGGMYYAWGKLTFDSTYLYLPDQANQRINKYNAATGAFVGSQGKVTGTTGTCPSSGVTSSWCTGGTFASGSLNGMYNGPYGAVMGADGYLYINDNSNYRVVRMQP